MAESNATSVPTAQPSSTKLDNPASPDADFRIERKEARNWQIILLSRRASHWFEANFTKDTQARGARVLETNLAGANAFIRKARVDGFRTEYIGPIAKSYF